MVKVTQHVLHAGRCAGQDLAVPIESSQLREADSCLTPASLEKKQILKLPKVNFVPSHNKLANKISHSFVWIRVVCTLSWPPIQSVAGDGFQLLIFLLPPPKVVGFPVCATMPGLCHAMVDKYSKERHSQLQMNRPVCSSSSFVLRQLSWNKDSQR